MNLFCGLRMEPAVLLIDVQEEEVLMDYVFMFLFFGAIIILAFLSWRSGGE